MIFLDYEKSIHHQCGKIFSLDQDIIVTPFWTEEFCIEIVKIAEYYREYFSKKIVWDNAISDGKTIGWQDITFESISPIFFEKFVDQYKEKIIPLISDIFKVSDLVSGWFSPYIIRYDTPGDHTDLHHDQSMITLNIKINNDYEGCDLIFPRQKFSTQNVPVGYATIWPSTVTHPHYSEPLISGIKYSVISWTWPPNWNMSGIKN